MDGIFFALLSLTIQTGSPRWPVREAATGQLRALLPGAKSFVQWGSRSKDAEVSARCKMLWREYLIESVHAKALHALPRWYAERPWLDMLDKDYPDRACVIDTYLSLARDKVGKGGPPLWTDYRQATLLFLERLYRDETPEAEIQDLLDSMAANEWKWINRHGDGYTPPLGLPWEKLLPGW